MKSAVRQQRHRLKKKYFDPFPLHSVRKTSPVKCMDNQQWVDLVETWMDPRKMETCEKNKENRELVKYHQTTGSRSYMVIIDNLGDQFEEDQEEPNAFDLFKLCHYNKKKKGYTPNVQMAINQMENSLSTPAAEDEQPKSATQVVADVLAEKTKKNQFLQNVGMQDARPRSSVRTELEAERRTSSEHRSIVQTQCGQIDELSRKFKESERQGSGIVRR